MLPPPAGKSPDRQRAFFGHPRGLGHIVFAEGWERFSFYGMQALLMLYMTGYLLQPENIGNVAALAAFGVSWKRSSAAVDAGTGVADLRLVRRLRLFHSGAGRP